MGCLESHAFLAGPTETLEHFAHTHRAVSGVRAVAKASFSDDNSKNAMADCFGVQSGMMKDTTNFIIENVVDNFDSASQGSREDIEHDPRFLEDRFRVDRKKLEQMLQLGKLNEHRGECSLTVSVSGRWFISDYCDKLYKA